MKRLKNIQLWTVILFVISNVHFVQGQTTKLISRGNSETIYFKSESLFNCKIKLPKNYHANEKQILVVGLHGFGSSSNAFVDIWDNLNNVDFIFASPQAPYTWEMNGSIGSDWSLWTSKDSIQIKRASELTIEYLSDLIVNLKKRYNISDVYLLGFSQGAIFTYLAGIQNFHLFKGIICLSGPGILEPLQIPFIGESSPNWLEEKYLEPAKSLRVFIAHGLEDKAVKYELALKSNKILSDYGYTVTFQTFDGGHTINLESLKRVLDWLYYE